MAKKVNINNIDFEAYLELALKSHGHLFPTTDEEMSVFEANMEEIPLPKKFETPNFVFDAKRSIFKPATITMDYAEEERNLALAAREGKEIPSDIRAQMQKDKEEAQKKQNGNK